MGITEAEQKKEKNIKRHEDSLRGLWNNPKHSTIHNIGFQKEKREKRRQITYLKTCV